MSAVAGSSSGRIPQGEVAIDFADGGSYIKHKLEQSVLDLERRKITREEGKKAQAAMEALSVTKEEPTAKSDDVDYVVAQLGCSRSEAEETLKANKGDLVKSLIQLVKPRQRAKSVDGGGELKAQ